MTSGGATIWPLWIAWIRADLALRRSTSAREILRRLMFSRMASIRSRTPALPILCLVGLRSNLVMYRRPLSVASWAR